MITKDSYMHTI